MYAKSTNDRLLLVINNIMAVIKFNAKKYYNKSEINFVNEILKGAKNKNYIQVGYYLNEFVVFLFNLSKNDYINEKLV